MFLVVGSKKKKYPEINLFSILQNYIENKPTMDAVVLVVTVDNVAFVRFCAIN